MGDTVEVLNITNASVEVLDNGGALVEVLSTDTQVVEVIVQGPQGPLAAVPAAISYIFDGGGVTLATGLKGSIAVPFACTINSWALVCDPLGSITVDVWKSTLAGYPPTVANSITGAAKPSITSGRSATSSSLTGWTTTVSAGDVLSFNIDSVSSAVLASLSLSVTRV